MSVHYTVLYLCVCTYIDKLFRIFSISLCFRIDVLLCMHVYTYNNLIVVVLPQHEKNNVYLCFRWNIKCQIIYIKAEQNISWMLSIENYYSCSPAFMRYLVLTWCVYALLIYANDNLRKCHLLNNSMAESVAIHWTKTTLYNITCKITNVDILSYTYL